MPLVHSPALLEVAPPRLLNDDALTCFALLQIMVSFQYLIHD
jgi:hypothetical protein